MGFDTQQPGIRRGVGRSVRWRLWLLFALLLAVLLVIGQLQEPATVDGLAKLFEPDRSGPATPMTSPDLELAAPGEVTPPVHEAPHADLSAEAYAVDPKRLTSVVDNTYLRDREAAAWSAVIEAAARTGPSRLAQQTLGEVPYAALIQQPEAYRGKVITVRGTVLREERLATDAGVAGVEAYHRLIVAPPGGGVRPLALYALQLPPAFPRGDQLHAPIAAPAIFFKSWSYRSTTGQLELAPLAVAPAIQWQPPPTAAPAKVTWPAVAIGVACCVAAAGAVAWSVAAATRRKPAARHADRQPPVPDWSGIGDRQEDRS